MAGKKKNFYQLFEIRQEVFPRALTIKVTL